MPTLPTRRRYKFANAPVVTTLAADMAAGATTFTLTSGTNWPGAGTGNFWVTIGAGTATEERILCSSTTGTTVTVASSGRGQDGTSAVAHSTGETVWVSWSATDADDANAHVSATGSDATVSIHGLASGSNVVGETDTQTLTNKTLTGPRISGTSSGTTLIQGSSAASGTITVPAVTGTLVTTGDTGTVTSTMIADGAIVDADINASANIASSKIASTLASKTLSSPTITSAGATFNNSGTGTTVLSSAAASGSYTLYFPTPAAGTATLVANTAAQELTNKTLGAGNDVKAGETLTNNGTISGGTVNATTLQIGGVTFSGAWTNVSSPTLKATTTNPTLGTGSSSTGKYIQIGKTVHFVFVFTFGSSGVNPGSGFYTVDLPVTAAISGNVFTGSFFDSNTGNYYRLSFLDSSTTSTGRGYWQDAGPVSQALGSSLPVVPAASDSIRISGTYEAA